MYTGLCVETYGKDKILWKWQTAFLKIYMLVVLWLYFYKIMTRCQCLKSILFRGVIFSDSLLERIILGKKTHNFHKEEQSLGLRICQSLELFVVIFTSQKITD